MSTMPVAPEAATGAGSAPLVSARNLVKHFPVRSSGIIKRQIGEVHAVCDVSFDIAENETLALVGESGCGKSTTARLLLSLLSATSGEVHYKGKDLQSLAAGHTSQAGLRGRQTVAPSSISAWLKSPGRSASTMRWAYARISDASSVSSNRDRTRFTLASTAGVRCPNAIDAMAPAV